MDVRWGFLGAGYVASRAMAPAVHEATGAVLESVASRDPARSADLEPRHVDTSYQELLDNPRVDAVYISLTNSQHREWVVAALRAGKHVLCEKPLGLSLADVRVMRSEAQHNDRLLVEATWVRWHPRFRRFVEIARSGTLGQVVRIDSAFTFMNGDPMNYRWSPEFGGGALLDVGCYQAHVWAAITGGDADVIVTSAQRELAPTGVDATTIADVTINGTVSARLECSFIREARQYLEVVGSDHRLCMSSGEAFTSWRESSSLSIDDVEETFAPADAFVLMVEAVSARIRGEESWLPSMDDTEAVARTLDAIASFPTL